MKVMSGVGNLTVMVLSSTLVMGAFARLLGLGIDQRTHAGGHRVALDGAVAPAHQVEHDVVRSEGVAVVPGHALTDMERVFGGVLVHVPLLEERGFEGEVAGVFHQRLEELAGHVRHLRPVVRARILLLLDEHRNADHAALLGLLRQRLGRRASPISE